MGLVFDEQLTLGREYALLGDYSTALVYFQALLQSIQKYIPMLLMKTIVTDDDYHPTPSFADLKDLTRFLSPRVVRRVLKPSDKELHGSGV